MVITKICFYKYINSGKPMKEKQPDYRALFASGVVFLGAGATFMISVNRGVGAGLMVLGCSFIIIGVKNKDRWKNKDKENQTSS